MKKYKLNIIIFAAFFAGLISSQIIDTNKPSPQFKIMSSAKAQSIFQYDYPQVIGGYRFNMLQRIFKECGIWPLDCPDIMIDGVWRTVPTFDIALSAEQKSALDILMADNPTFPPTPTGTKFQAIDLYENRATLSTKWGKNFWVWWDESVRGSGSFDKVLLYFDDNLSIAQRNAVRTEYGNLLTQLP